MIAKTFVDTNVLVYSRDSSEVEKQHQALTWMTHLWQSKTGTLSYQVLQEFYAVVTGKLKPGLSPKRARDDIRALFAWKPIPADARVVQGAWFVQDRNHFSWWDALIVSAAQVADCQYLLSEDFQENQKLGKLVILNPFKNSPESVTS
ncbi:PIN domain-containing protein [candidate division CSSED10-310 bacterium]|uniref:PIN domain-containing protein n=1 Tax=candidate division CSSED10-310 bacterium TaxID=2855610 RepID=A0ABV6YVU1_UNCC1